MIKLRLKRFGKKREASYRIVAIDGRARRQGRAIEELGFYNPRTDETKLDVEGIVKRLEQGAQPTDTVRHILERANILQRRPHPAAAVATVEAAAVEASAESES
jgi:small subunit ribosomal protein S16